MNVPAYTETSVDFSIPLESGLKNLQPSNSNYFLCLDSHLKAPKKQRQRQIQIWWRNEGKKIRRNKKKNKPWNLNSAVVLALC